MIRAATWMELTSLILVPGHGVCKAGCTGPAVAPLESSWAGPFPGEGRLYIQHIRHGVELAAADPTSALMFSGGQTRVEAGPRSEAESYREIAAAAGWWEMPEVAGRVLIEGFARDSLENLLFALARFRQATDRWPRTITVAGWGFKEMRYDWHCHALQWPRDRYHYVGVNHPDRDAWQDALMGEMEKLRTAKTNLYLAGPEWATQRQRRDPFRRGHPYRGIDPGLDSLLDALEGRTDSPTPPQW